jgi:predicted MFS family arabinose efflux permease
MSAGLPVYAYDEFTRGRSWIAGLFYAASALARSSEACSRSSPHARSRPFSTRRYAALVFVLPLWCFRLLHGRSSVALFVATLFTPLINGPIIAVLTARTPAELRAKVMTAVISINTLAAPLGFLVAGQVLDRWGVAPPSPQSCSA